MKSAMAVPDTPNDGRTIVLTVLTFLALCAVGALTAGFEEVREPFLADIMGLLNLIVMIAALATIGFFVFALIRAERRLQGRRRIHL